MVCMQSVLHISWKPIDDSTFIDSINCRLQILEKNSREFQKEKPKFAKCQQLVTQHLHCILGISNLEMI